MFLKGSLKNIKKTAASNKGDIEAGPVAGKLDYQDEAEAVNNENSLKRIVLEVLISQKTVKYFSGKI